MSDPSQKYHFLDLYSVQENIAMINNAIYIEETNHSNYYSLLSY